jgi:alcohol dehydrogenase class IV
MTDLLFARDGFPALAARLGELGTKKVMLITGSSRRFVDLAATALAKYAPVVFDGARVHVPIDVVSRAGSELAACEADTIVAIGGGSAIGLGKALAVRTGVPQLAIPTTYAGSEMTPILGETEEGKKTTRRSPDILPEAVIYDVDLTLSLPPAMSGPSGMNAIAHAVEALYAQDTNPITSLMAEEAIAALARALPVIVEHPADLAARTDALYGAWLCGTCLGTVGMALHHKLCHVLGGAFDLPHADTHAVVLPHAAAYNAPVAPTAMAKIARALGARSAPLGLFELARRVGARRGLAELGMPASGIDHATDLAMQHPYWNPRPLDRAAIRDLIARAYAGDEPDA